MKTCWPAHMLLCERKAVCVVVQEHTFWLVPRGEWVKSVRCDNRETLHEAQAGETWLSSTIAAVRPVYAGTRTYVLSDSARASTSCATQPCAALPLADTVKRFSRMSFVMSGCYARRQRVSERLPLRMLASRLCGRGMQSGSKRRGGTS